MVLPLPVLFAGLMREYPSLVDLARPMSPEVESGRRVHDVAVRVFVRAVPWRGVHRSDKEQPACSSPVRVIGHARFRASLAGERAEVFRRARLDSLQSRVDGSGSSSVIPTSILEFAPVHCTAPLFVLILSALAHRVPCLVAINLVSGCLLH